MMPFPESGGAKVMQGKDSLCVDIRTPEGARIIHELAAAVDIVLDGFRPGVAERLGVGPGALAAINPQLVYVSASGYGEGGPYSNRPAFAPSIGSAGGIARANLGSTVQEIPGLTPAEIRDGSIRMLGSTAVVQAQADGFAALGVATSLLIGLLARDRTGEGQRVSSSMLLTNAHAMAEEVVDVETVPPHPGIAGDFRGTGALYRIYDADDGWVFLAAGTDREWSDLVGALKPHVDLAGDDRFTSRELRHANDDQLVEALSAVFARRGKDEWEAELLAADVACVAVSTERVERFLQGEVGRASGYVVDVTHPTFDEHPRLAPLVRFSRSATQAKPGVLAGNATDAVLAELGYDEAAIAGLRERSIVA
jgi:crotonobetainyl-CoA:carnitine CoA-transferase CaiB-like acyl-CoA transferase